MSHRQFCDRCDVDITNEKCGAVVGIDDADEQGNGSVTERADLCVSCYVEFARWLATKVREASRQGEGASNR